MRIRRALLFMPGDDRRKIEKGAGLAVDSIIMDLEDGVALNRKAEARAITREALQTVDFGAVERLVRLNPVDGTGWYLDDLNAIVTAWPDGYVLPKVESAEQVWQVSNYLDAAEGRHNRQRRTVLLAIIESAKGVMNLREIVMESGPRLVALALGAEDLAGDMGARRSAEGTEGFYARSAVVLHAKAMGLQAIDTPYVNLTDLDGLQAETAQACDLGYTGKLAIHPRQVDPIQATFTPTDSEIAQAQALIHAHAVHQSAGTGVFAFEGKMVDMPMIRAAESVLQRAQAAGISLDSAL
jgi:citrate lyase subunit beta/citryl-CoA lyase